MSLLLTHRALYKIPVVGEKILITMTPTALFTVGINLTFASGTLTIDWKDGSSSENFVSDAELTHQYVSSGTYIAEITGDLENITKFIADNNRITFIENSITGLLVDFRIQSNLYVGNLDMSLATVSGILFVQTNPNLTGITFATSGNGVVSTFSADSCNLSTLDFSNVPVSGTFDVDSNSNLTGITFSSSGNGVVSAFTAILCNLSSLDFSNVPVSGTFFTRVNPNLSSLTFSSSGNGLFTDCRIDRCNLSSLDFSNVPISGNLFVFSNSSLSSMTFSSSGNGALSIVLAYSCSLPNLDFSVFPTSDGVDIQLYSNGMTATEHDNQLINLDATGWINGTLQIITGNTARTAASDTAYNNLIANGWTIT